MQSFCPELKLAIARFLRLELLHPSPFLPEKSGAVFQQKK
jgi:hypothetical protein